MDGSVYLLFILTTTGWICKKSLYRHSWSLGECTNNFGYPLSLPPGASSGLGFLPLHENTLSVKHHPLFLATVAAELYGWQSLSVGLPL